MLGEGRSPYTTAVAYPPMMPPAMIPTPKTTKVRTTDTATTVTVLGALVLPVVFAGLPGPAFGAGGLIEVAVLDGTQPSASEDARAVGLRLRGLIVRDLGRLGIPAWLIRDAARRPTLDAEISVEPLLGDNKLTAIVRIKHGAELSLKKPRSDDAIDQISQEVALETAALLGFKISEAARAALLAEPATPFLVHRAVGLAELDLEQGRPQAARMRFDRATELQKSALPECLDGAFRAEAAGAKDLLAKGELARSSLERAEGKLREKRPAEAAIALETFVKLTPDRAFFWAIPERGLTRMFPLDHEIVAQGPGKGGLITVAVETGSVRALPEAKGALVASVGEDLVFLSGRTLVRLARTGKERFSLEIKGKKPPTQAVAIGGYLAVLVGEELWWVDLALGAVKERVSDVEPLAFGPDGALLRQRADQKLALVRPGRRAPTWAIADPLGKSSSARAVAGRILLFGPESLTIVDADSGKVRGTPFAVEPGSTVLGAHGRFLVLSTPPTGARIFDVLGASEVSKIEGPAPAVVASIGERGLWIGSASGDLLAVDREGVVVDRALVLGVPAEMVPLGSVLPGHLVRTDRGLFAIGEVPADGATRDVDALLRLARLYLSIGDRRGAERVAEAVARSGMGRVAEAESLRAELLEGRGAVAAAARERAKVLTDLRRPAPRFRLAGDPAAAPCP